jgi:hypothetical protein
MPITNMVWQPEANLDRHVVKGQSSPDLTVGGVVFSTSTGLQFAHDYLAANTDVSLTFTPLFKGTRNGNLLEAAGISFDTTTGVCTVDPAAAALPIHNFIVEVVAAPSPAGAAGTTFREVIRFHVHGSVVRTWLTPATLTVRRGAKPPANPQDPESTNYRFTVHAQYDDDTVADITVLHGVTWEPAANFINEGRIQLQPGDAPSSTITVHASYPATGGPVQCQGTVSVADTWANTPNPPKASVVAGGGWPGAIRPQSVPNVLFFGDGFSTAQADKDAFNNITDSLVQHLNTDKLLRPFDILATSMNYWRTLIPSTRGISVRSELYHVSEGGKDYVKALPAVTKPAPNQPWTIENLLYAVGLPVPADKTTANTALKAAWANQLTDDPTPHLNDDLVDTWKTLADRVFAEELDSFPGLSYGLPPAVNRSDENYMLDLHDGRGSVALLQSFYQTVASDSGLTLDQGITLGHLWGDTNPIFQSTTDFDNTDLVVIVTSVPGGRALNGTGYIALPARSADIWFEVKPYPPSRSVPLTYPDIPPEASKDSCRTMAHELAHSFGVGDEYADYLAPYAPQASPIDEWANLETSQNVKDAAGHFVGAQIKWTWPRIKKAAVIADQITGAATGPFTIPVRTGHGLQFAIGDKLLLRVRLSGKPLKASVDALTSSEELAVVSRTTDSVVVSPVTAGSVTLADIQNRFAPGSIVFLATPAPSSVRSASYPYAEIVALNVKTEITNGNRPLWAQPATDQTKGPTVQSPNLDKISLPGVWCNKNKPRIIGLYEGGYRYLRDIYHPAGTCMMRNDHEDTAEFCHVCRYIIVDMIDPSKHFQIDLDYANWYAQG